MTTSDPPVVSIQGHSTPVIEDSKLELTCGITPGNPVETDSPTWEFVPIYPDSPALPGEMEDTKLTLEKVVYTDAGTYSCTARNSAGSETGELAVIVHCE